MATASQLPYTPSRLQGTSDMNSEWIVCIGLLAYRPLVMIQAYEAPTLQSLMGYTSMVQAMNARCS